MSDKNRRVGVGYNAEDMRSGEITLRIENGHPEITIRDKRGLNTKTAGIVLGDQKLKDLGYLLVQLGYGTSLHDADAGLTVCRQSYTSVEE